jgi:hypothetical protein
VTNGVAIVTRKPRGQAAVEAEVRKALGKDAQSLSRAELARLVRRFLRAGRAALRSRSGGAAERLTLAKAELTAARKQLVVAQLPEGQSVFLDRRWKRLYRSLEDNRDRLLGYAGVVGLALGYRRRNGIETDEPCIIVLISRKLGRPALKRASRKPLPRSVAARSGPRIPIDVVDFGHLKPHLQGGDSLGPVGRNEKATIGLFATDDLTGETVALTAMHATDLFEFPPGPDVDFTAPSSVDSASPRFLGTLIEGTRTDVDAAKISVVAGHSPSFSIKGIGPVRGARWLALPGDHGAAVRMFGAVSGFRTGRIAIPYSIIQDDEMNLNPAILVEIATDAGDSGAVIVDNASTALGFLVGVPSRFPQWRAFSPARLVLEKLSCSL